MSGTGGPQVRRGYRPDLVKGVVFGELRQLERRTKETIGLVRDRLEAALDPPLGQAPEDPDLLRLLQWFECTVTAAETQLVMVRFAFGLVGPEDRDAMRRKIGDSIEEPSNG